MNTSALIYDCEIEKCIPERDGTPPDPTLTYCRGWDDHANMGITCICAWDFQTHTPRVFLKDNLGQFAVLVKERETIIGFNSVFFDDLLCRANGIEVTTTYDLLVEVRRATLENPANGDTRDEWRQSVSRVKQFKPHIHARNWRLQLPVTLQTSDYEGQVIE